MTSDNNLFFSAGIVYSETRSWHWLSFLFWYFWKHHMSRYRNGVNYFLWHYIFFSNSFTQTNSLKERKISATKKLKAFDRPLSLKVKLNPKSPIENVSEPRQKNYSLLSYDWQNQTLGDGQTIFLYSAYMVMSHSSVYHLFIQFSLSWCYK